MSAREVVAAMAALLAWWTFLAVAGFLIGAPIVRLLNLGGC